MSERLTTPFDWNDEGFARMPEIKKVETPLRVYRCWGGDSSEEGNPKRKGVCFTDTRPTCVSDAELRLSVVEWGNLIRRISTFELEAGLVYWVGPVKHNARDIQLPANQIFILNPINPSLVKKVGQSELLQQDFVVSHQIGHAS